MGFSLLFRVKKRYPHRQTRKAAFFPTRMDGCVPLRAERKRQGEPYARLGGSSLAHPANNAPTRQKQAAKEIETRKMVQSA